MACGPDYRVLPSTKAPLVRSMADGASDGVRVPDGMRIIAAYGDDTWRLGGPGRIRFGAAGGGYIPTWDDRWIYVVDESRGQPVAAVALSGRRITAAAVDASGTRVAALVDDGSALYWPTFAAVPVPLVPVPVATAAEDSGYVPAKDSRGEDAWALERAARRLSFSPAGDRLLAGMHLWDLSSRRDLLPLRRDEIVLDATHHAALVARIGVETVHGEPGGQCDFEPVDHRLTLAALELRAVDEPPLRSPRHGAIPSDASVAQRRVWLGNSSGLITTDRADVPTVPAPPVSTPRPPRALHGGIASLDVADDGRLVFVENRVGWLLDEGVATALRVPDDRADITRFGSVSLGGRGIYAVVVEDQPGRRPSALYAMDVAGAARVRVAGRAEHVSRAGRAVIGRGDRFEEWDLSGAPGHRAVDFRPRNLSTNDQGRSAGRGRVVLRDTEPSSSIVEVRDPGAAPRRLGIDGAYSSLWAVAEDGSAVAAMAGERPSAGLYVLSLDDGHVLLHEPPAPGTEIVALAVSAQVIAAADTRGIVRVWRRGRAADIDLAGRYDMATALAISPDQALLAIGTGRGRIYVVALNPRPSPVMLARISGFLSAPRVPICAQCIPADQMYPPRRSCVLLPAED
jgi:hypothetical protein